MYKVLIQHHDGEAMRLRGDILESVRRADEKLAAGLICEVKVTAVEVQGHDQSPERKRTKRRSAG